MVRPTEMPNDLQIARQAERKPLKELAADWASAAEQCRTMYGSKKPRNSSMGKLSSAEI